MNRFWKGLVIGSLSVCLFEGAGQARAVHPLSTHPLFTAEGAQADRELQMCVRVARQDDQRLNCCGQTFEAKVIVWNRDHDGVSRVDAVRRKSGTGEMVLYLIPRIYAENLTAYQAGELAETVCLMSIH